jgi:hypothetical protein
MKEKMLVKVVASVMQEVDGRLLQSTARGISPLKRGATMSDFIFSFLEERHVNTYSLNQRSDDSWATSPITMSEEPRIIVTYHFVRFPASEVGFNAKDLTALELERDMKQMKKFING